MKSISMAVMTTVLACSSTILAQPKPNMRQLADQYTDALARYAAPTCQNAASLRKIASQMPANLSQQLNDRADEHASKAQKRLIEAIADGERIDAKYVAGLDDPAGDELLKTYPTKARAAIAELTTCLEENAKSKVFIAKIKGDIDAKEKEIASLLAAETKCRATPSCMAGRMVEGICDAIAARKALAYELARERANAAGVVNLRTLHDTGDEIAEADREIKESKAEYQKATKKMFSNSLCKTK
jgi:hypothetical protein